VKLKGFASWFAGAAVVMLGVGGIAKLFDLPAFVGTLSAWRFLPVWSHSIIAMLVPVCETALAGAWFLSGRRDVVVWMALALYVTFSGALTVHYVVDKAETCGCLGKISLYYRSLDGFGSHMARNGLAIAALAGWVALNGRAGRRDRRAGVPNHPEPAGPLAGPPAGPPDRGTAPPAAAGPRGFTLVEMLIVILVAGVIMSLTLPALFKTRVHSKTTISLNKLQQHASIMQLYCNDFKGLYPYFGDPAAGKVILKCRTLGIDETDRYFEAWNQWHIGMIDSYYTGVSLRIFTSPFLPTPADSLPTSLIRGSHYLQPCVFIADPDFFTRDKWELPPLQLRAVADSETLFPSDKALTASFDVSDRMRLSGDRTIHAAFCDGHARAVPPELAAVTFYRGDGRNYEALGGHPAGIMGPPMTHTLGGVRGRDLGE